MIFKQAKNIDTAFRHIKGFSILLVTGSLGLAVYAMYASNKTVSQSQQKIFILANGKALEAFAADRKDNVPVEARDHVKMFHHYFFTLDPDDKVIQSNITKALYLADGSAKQQYDNLKENSYYAQIISGNISQTVVPDSITVDINRYPYYFRYSGIQQIIRPTSIVTRTIVSEGYLRSVSRSDNNPHGFLIEKWRTLENKDIQTATR
ncbi:conjugative transposon protein TraK [Terrimonas alba]|uniref:conjugative transposon protein TraK n=1 Tax=Terrimonas alba TaxID=3349636 RepID=UPI0035F3CF8D